MAEDSLSLAARFVALLEEFKKTANVVHFPPMRVGSVDQYGRYEQYPSEHVYRPAREAYDNKIAEWKLACDALRERVAEAAKCLTVDARRMNVEWGPVLRFTGTWSFELHYLDAWTQAATLAAVFTPASSYTKSPDRPVDGLVTAVSKKKSYRQSHPVRHPSADAIATYRVWFATQQPQAEIAKIMTAQTGKPIQQNQVSRMLRQVKKYLVSGNVLPDLPKPAPRAKFVDPSRLDMGKRETGLTQKQRSRDSEED